MSRNLLRYTCSYLTYVLAAHSPSALTYNMILTPMRTRRVKLEGSTKDSCEWLLNYVITKLVYYDLSAYKHDVAPLQPSGRPSEARGTHSLKVLESALIFRPIAFYIQMRRKSLICVDALTHLMSCCPVGMGLSNAKRRRCHLLELELGLGVSSFTPPLMFR